MKKVELLAPAGSLEKLKIAIIYGADAVFIGGKAFSLRSSASNFSLEEIKEAVEFANKYNAHIHVTVNAILHEEDLDGLKEYLIELEKIGVTAIIIADLHIAYFAKQVTTKLEVHLSTQLSISNSKAANYFKNKNFDRVVLAREVSFENLKKIRDNTDIALEYFIHGAMCINVSGRCMLSNYFNNRDANRGGCSQSCRWKYGFNNGENENLIDSESQFAMSAKDLALAKQIPELIAAGIDSFKVEGRMKSIHYIATVINVYRKIIDNYYKDNNFVVTDEYLKELKKAANRETSSGFYYGNPNHEYQLYNQRDEHPNKEFIGVVIDYNEKTKLAKIEQRNYFEKEDVIEFFGYEIENFEQVVSELFDEAYNDLDIARHPQQIIYLKTDKPVFTNNMLRLVKKKNEN